MIAGEFRRDETPPFLVKVFYRTGAHHRPDEFNSPTLPPHLPIHTWPDCTLDELSSHIAAATPSVLPSPAIGTRLIFRLIYADTRAPRSDALSPRYVPKDLGSVVLGRGGPGAGPDEGVSSAGEGDGAAGAGGETTLAEAKFITGDFICCAIMPPDELSGDVVPASSARMGRGTGVGEATGLVGGPPPPPPMAPRQRDYGFSGGFRGRGGFRGGGGGGPRGYYGGGGGRGRYRDREEPFGRDAGGMPQGEWRRGDRLPDDPPESGWRGR
ncbi:Sin3 associated polypeptide p18-domain-containing protein [Staphylotrichum tortipilum]|uniref:Sin3 associated polypeptide p18-domain-containing protein n=1 Tax=Staphylotrichum tortipilum TaxID=2831512 RepID=A0AAN6MEZ3_9PEZI|nr:Sin3 associated polypeptide p18-domain-containing protein [Staphylotrichum longicolle]